MYDFFKFYIGVIKKELDKQKKACLRKKKTKTRKHLPQPRHLDPLTKDIWTNKEEMEKLNKEFNSITPSRQS